LFRQTGNLRYLSEIVVLPVTLGHLVAGHFDAATRSTEECVDIATRIGFVFSACLAPEMLGSIALAKGDYQRALAYFARSVDDSTSAACSIMRILLTASTSQVYADLGVAFSAETRRWQQ
jgi:hypothetical protein